MKTANLTKMSISLSAQIEASALLAHPIIRAFIENPEHRRLFKEFTEQQSHTAKEQLEAAFRHFFFGIRFSVFLRSTIRFSEIELARKQRKYQNRHPLVFDKQVDEEGEQTIGESLLCLLATERIDDATTKPEVFFECLDHEALSLAFNQLSDRQKIIITLAYSQSMRDTEIARCMSISQQSVCKTRGSALQKLKKAVNI